jgi:hypothetical protein
MTVTMSWRRWRHGSCRGRCEPARVMARRGSDAGVGRPHDGIRRAPDFFSCASFSSFTPGAFMA